MTNKNTLSKIQSKFLAYKKLAGNVKFIACFGKTFVDKDKSEYMISKKVGSAVIKYGFGVLHGGYTGIMQAISEGAKNEINSTIKNRYLNIGAPMKQFDGKVKRANCIHLPAAENILDRKRILVEMCDACIVLPTGGIGTLLEAIEIFHMNQISEKFGGKIRPIIFYGKIWKKIMSNLIKQLDLQGQSLGTSFVQYVTTNSELKKALLKLTDTSDSTA